MNNFKKFKEGDYVKIKGSNDIWAFFYYKFFHSCRDCYVMSLVTENVTEVTEDEINFAGLEDIKKHLDKIKDAV